jgi:hypothetical protein
VIEANQKRFHWLLTACRRQQDSTGKANERNAAANAATHEDPGETNHAAQPSNFD